MSEIDYILLYEEIENLLLEYEALDPLHTSSIIFLPQDDNWYDSTSDIAIRRLDILDQIETLIRMNYRPYNEKL